MCPVIINNEAWSPTSLQVNLYVCGSGSANEMRFRNEGGNWSNWESFSASKCWTLSCNNGSPAIVYAQIENDSTILESRDEFNLTCLSVQPDATMLFPSEQGATPTIPVSHQMSIACCESWNASADQPWIRLGTDSGSGSAMVTVSLEGFPTVPETYTGNITVSTTSEEQANVQIVFVVTNRPVGHSYVPVIIKE